MNPKPLSRSLVATLTVVSLAVGICGSASASDFRGLEWGASPADVKATERHPLHHERADEIAYWNFKLGGIEAGLVYTFENGRLVRAHYLSRNPTSDPAEDLSDYMTFQRMFDEHFGEHVSEEWVWADDGEHEAEERTLAAITSGSVERITRWELETTRVKLLIAGKDGAVSTVRAIFAPR